MGTGSGRGEPSTSDSACDLTCLWSMSALMDHGLLLNCRQYDHFDSVVGTAHDVPVT